MLHFVVLPPFHFAFLCHSLFPFFPFLFFLPKQSNHIYNRKTQLEKLNMWSFGFKINYLITSATALTRVSPGFVFAAPWPGGRLLDCSVGGVGRDLPTFIWISKMTFVSRILPDLVHTDGLLRTRLSWLYLVSWLVSFDGNCLQPASQLASPSASPARRDDMLLQRQQQFAHQPRFSGCFLKIQQRYLGLFFFF